MNRIDPTLYNGYRLGKFDKLVDDIAWKTGNEYFADHLYFGLSWASGLGLAVVIFFAVCHAISWGWVSLPIVGLVISGLIEHTPNASGL